LDFSTFNPKIFRIFNFRAEKFWPEKLSRQKNPGLRTFKPKIFGWKKISNRAGGTRSAGKILGHSVLSVERISQKRVFSNFRGDLFEIF
jgi:hypothetical protein